MKHVLNVVFLVITAIFSLVGLIGIFTSEGPSATLSSFALFALHSTFFAQFLFRLRRDNAPTPRWLFLLQSYGVLLMLVSTYVSSHWLAGVWAVLFAFYLVEVFSNSDFRKVAYR